LNLFGAYIKGSRGLAWFATSSQSPFDLLTSFSEPCQDSAWNVIFAAYQVSKRGSNSGSPVMDSAFLDCAYRLCALPAFHGRLDEPSSTIRMEVGHGGQPSNHYYIPKKPLIILLYDLRDHPPRRGIINPYRLLFSQYRSQIGHNPVLYPIRE